MFPEFCCGDWRCVDWPQMFKQCQLSLEKRKGESLQAFNGDELLTPNRVKLALGHTVLN